MHNRHGIFGKTALTYFGVVLVNFLLLTGAMAQTTPEMAANLKAIAAEGEAAHQEQSARVREFAIRKNLPVSFTDSQGNYVLMVDVTWDDKPVYTTTLNSAAAITTGVVSLRTGGGLGINLEGEGMIAGVWDGGTVRSTHREIAGRIISTSGPDGGNHPSHVTGTIIASGVNLLAKGMAPKAKVMSFYFDNDLSTISSNASSLLLSNHSYGPILGWYFNNGWTWVGSSGVSNDEDFRFGFYGSDARQIDQVTVNAPYYTMVWAAGNERNNTGAAGHPPDCNAGSGYDCIGGKATAKNVITVGAVNKVTTYNDPSSVVMSSFSSWGPTDDGRIKPDLVGDGVNLFSLSSANDSAYTTLSGTSMASPNVTGSLLLLQELYKNLHSSTAMRSSTLKALAIHTAKEAGVSPGPDYRFGWGLLDAEAAAKVLLGQNDLDVVVQEYSLANNETFELTLEPKLNQKLTATIAWTDPAGNSPGISLDPTDLMLVNDLDMRLIDDANNKQFPWILDLGNVSAPADRGDNIRDNVEKIEFNNPEQRVYKLQVKSKKTLVNGPQVFSLILTYKSVADSRTKLYWVGGSGNWQDGTHWSLSSGGSPASVVPTIDNRVVFDENSFSGAGSTVSLNANASCYSLTWFAKAAASLSLSGNTLTIDGDLNISSTTLTFPTAGAILLSGDVSKQNTIFTSNIDLSNVALSINEANATWVLNGDLKIKSIDLIAGQLVADRSILNVSTISAVGSLPRTLSIKQSTIKSIAAISFAASNFTLKSDSAVLELAGASSAAGAPVVISNNGVYIKGKVKTTSGFVKFTGSGSYSSMDLIGSIEMTGSNAIDTLKVGLGSVITLGAGATQALTANTNFISTNALPITINGAGTSTMNFEGHYRLCFDNLKINNTNKTGEAVVNAGLNSILNSSANWENIACENVLFADFDFQYNCVNSLTKFSDKSLGLVDSWLWSFGDIASNATSVKQNSNHKFATAGTYSVTLTVKKGAVTRSYTKDIVIGPNVLVPYEVLLSNGSFFSTGSSSKYEWYKNDNQILGETARTYKFDGTSGVYFSLIFDNKCNLPSTSFVTVSVKEDAIFSSASNLVYPNPSKTGEFNVSVPSEWLPLQINVYDVMGRHLLNQELVEKDGLVQLPGSSPGMYLLRLSNDRVFRTQKIEVVR